MKKMFCLSMTAQVFLHTAPCASSQKRLAAFRFDNVRKVLISSLCSLFCSCGMHIHGGHSEDTNIQSIIMAESQSYFDSLSGLVVYNIADTYPTYNGQPWILGLGKDFDRMFSYKYSEGEEHCFRVVVQFVIDKDGKLVAPRIIECKNDSFGRAVLNTLLSCQCWTPGVVGNIEVNTILTLPIVW